ncbi:MAG: ComEC/Rec2 family competence protein [Caldilineaceae bacterium]
MIEDGLLITIAANITTSLLVVFYFGRLSLVSLLTNVLIAPVQSFIMLGGTLGVIVGVAGAPWLSQVILIVPWLSLVWTVAMVQWTAALPGASLDVAAYGSGALAVTYLLLGLTLTRGSLTAWGRRFLRDGLGAAGRRLASPVVLGVGGIGCVLVWMLALSQPDGRLHVHFLDIGQGDAVSSSRRRRAVRCSSTAAPVPRRSSANWARSCPSGTVTSTCSCSPIPTATT